MAPTAFEQSNSKHARRYTSILPPTSQSPHTLFKTIMEQKASSPTSRLQLAKNRRFSSMPTSGSNRGASPTVYALDSQDDIEKRAKSKRHSVSGTMGIREMDMVG